jgi:phage gp29-like protein
VLLFIQSGWGLPVEVDNVIKYHATIREGTYANPRGVALYSRLYAPWFYRVNGWKFWAKFLERSGVPFMLGKSTRDTQALATAMAGAISNSSLAIAMDDEVSIMAANSGTAPFEAFEIAICKRYQRLVLGQTLTSDTQGVGSQALGTVHQEVKKEKRDSDVRVISHTMQGIVDAVWLLNNFPGPSPRWIMEDGKGLEPERADRDLKLSQIGVQLAPEYFNRAYDFEPGEVLKVEKSAPPALGLTPDPNAPPPNDPALKGSIDPLLRSTVDVLRSGGSYQMAMTELANEFPEIGTAELERKMSTAFFVADVFSMT